MTEKGQLNPEEIRIQGVLDLFLKRHAGRSGQVAEADHLDEDSLTAFVEGNLSRREAVPVVSHLTGCSFCRQITAELVKLELAFADEPLTAETNNQPSRVSDVLSNLLSRIFGSGDAAVFAHHESEEKETEETKDKEE